VKNIIICGLIGTGKTTLSKRISREKEEILDEIYKSI